MKTKTILSALALCLATVLSGQNSSVIDSLYIELEKAKEDTNKANILNMLGFELRNTRPDQSLQYYNQSLALSEKLDFKWGIFRTYYNIGKLHYYMGNDIESLNSLMAGVQMAEEVANDKRSVEILGNFYLSIGNCYLNSRNNKEAIKYFRSAIPYFNQVNYKLGLAIVNRNIALSFEKIDYDESVKYYQEALKFSEEIGHIQEQYESLLGIGKVYSKQGNLPQAIRYLEKGLNITNDTDSFNRGPLYNSLGTVYRHLGNFEVSLDMYIKANNCYEKAGDLKGISWAYVNIGVIYQMMKNYDDAMRNFEEGMKIMKETGDLRNLAIVFNNIGLNHFYMRNYPEAERYFLQALQINEELKSLSGISSNYLNLGITYANQKKYDEGAQNMIAAIEISKTLNDSISLPCMYANLGMVSLMKVRDDTVIKTGKDYSQIYDYLNNGLAIAKKTGDKTWIMYSYIYLSNADSIRGDFASALSNYILYKLYNDSLVNEESNRHVNNLKILYETEKNEREIEKLNKDNEIKSLQLEHQEASLLASRLEVKNNQTEIQLLNKTKEIQELQLSKTQEDLKNQRMEAEVRAAGLELVTKEKELKQQQLEKQKLLRNSMAFGIVFLVILGLLLFRGWRMKKKLEKQQAILQERKRISADLHDDIGSGLSKISLLSEVVRQEAKTTEAKKEAEKIAATSRELLDNIREIIWTLNANNDYLDNLVSYIRRYASEYFENSSVNLIMEDPVRFPEIPINGEYRRNIFYSVKEAMHNIIKHAEATEAEIQFKLEKDTFMISVRDNGKGFPPDRNNQFGNGLKNIMHRMETLMGNVSVENHKGTKVTLIVPV